MGGVHCSIAYKIANLERLCWSEDRIDNLWRVIMTCSSDGRPHSTQCERARSAGIHTEILKSILSGRKQDCMV